MTSPAKVASVADLILNKLDGIEAALKAAHYTPEAAGLSPAESALVDRTTKRAMCILEQDMNLGDLDIPARTCPL